MVTPVRTFPGRIPLSTKAYVLGAALGGFSAGLVVAVAAVLLGWLPDSIALLLAVSGSLYGAAADLTGHRIWFPGARRQVPQSVPHRGVPGFIQFGFEMGTGMRTYMPVALPVVVAFAMAVLGFPRAGLLGGLAFGVARGTLHLLKWCSGNAEWQGSLDRLSMTTHLRTASLIGIFMIIVAVALR